MALFRALQQIDFPSSQTEKVYYPIGITGLSVAADPTNNTILYLPYYIKKNISNPKLLIQQTGTSACTVKVGIYSGLNGIYGASLLVNDEITTTSTAQIYEKQVTINLSAGFYILAGVRTSGSASSFRASSNTGIFRSCFGDLDSITSIDNNNYYTETGQTSLPSSIGTITRTSTAGAGIHVFIKY